MNELEIAQYAARAANWESRRFTVRDLEVVHVRRRHADDAPWRLFAPLASDQDAAELAAAARIDVSHYDGYVAAMAGIGQMRIFAHDDIDVDKLPDLDCAERRRATRRVITECAAIVGRDLGPLWWRKA